jgi:hypothetical protein
MTATATAGERLAQSRELLRQALHDLSPAPNHKQAQADHANAFGGDWLSQITSVPGVNLLVKLFQEWWAQQPLHVKVSQAADAAKAALQPLAQRHPYALVFAACIGGALLVLARPWRWLSTPALLAGLLPTLIKEVMKLMPESAPTACAKDR